MSKTGWIIVAVLVWLLFRDRIAGAVDSVTGRPRSPGDYYGAPPPGPGYYSSPPTSPNSTVSDIVGKVISGATSIYNTYRSGPGAPSPSNPGAVGYPGVLDGVSDDLGSVGGIF